MNADDQSWQYFAKAVPNVVTYGIEQGDLRAADITMSAEGSNFSVHYQGHTLPLHINLPGMFNISNALAAVAVGQVLQLDGEVVKRGLMAVKGVPGRMERIDEGQPFNLFVDFAVTPDALEKALEAVRAMTNGRVMVIFGATGDRDKTKRPEMGEIAARLADVIYLTDDETYTEIRIVFGGWCVRALKKLVVPRKPMKSPTGWKRSSRRLLMPKKAIRFC